MVTPRKKMMDIRRREKSAEKISALAPKPEKKPELLQPKKIEQDLKNLCKEVEQFEKKEEKNFLKEEKIKKEKNSKFKKRGKIVMVVSAVAVLVIIGGFYLANKFLARADIQITTKKTEWGFNDSIMASKTISSFDAVGKQIPAEIFTSAKNYTFSYPATDKKSVQDKAAGTITIYNKSSAVLSLQATTRFQAPDGKIFRLASPVMAVRPNDSIDAAVVADEAGPAYNIGPVSHFSIPGFKDSTIYKNVYAESKQAMSGGFIGERPFPTDIDIKQAKQKAESDFKNLLDSTLAIQLPQDFKFIDGSKQSIISKEQVNNRVDDKGNFTIYLEGKSSAIGFKENDLKNLMENLGQDFLGQTFKVKSFEADYGAGRADFDKGRISYALNFKGIFEEPLDMGNFMQQISGKTADGIKSVVSNLTNIDKAAVSFWPFWVRSVPGDLSRVKVEVK